MYSLPMNEDSRNDIRRLLKSFGVKADEALTAYLEKNPGNKPLHVRVVLEDLTDYGDAAPAEPLYLEIEGEIRR